MTQINHDTTLGGPRLRTIEFLSESADFTLTIPQGWMPLLSTWSVNLNGDINAFTLDVDVNSGQGSGHWVFPADPSGTYWGSPGDLPNANYLAIHGNDTTYDFSSPNWSGVGLGMLLSIVFVK